MQPIVPVTLPVKNIEGAACQLYGDRVVWCEQTLRHACWRTDVNAIQLLRKIKNHNLQCYSSVLRPGTTRYLENTVDHFIYPKQSFQAFFGTGGKLQTQQTIIFI